MHARDWIAEESRFRRQVNAKQLRQVLSRQSGECTWCGTLVSGRRVSWCSKECTDAFASIIPDTIRRLVLIRDRGICSLCGVDCLRMASLRYRVRCLPGCPDVFEALVDEWHARGFKEPQKWRDLWEADHIVPVCEGGGLCGVEGFRTLCQGSHTRVSREQHARRSEKKSLRA